MWGYDGVVSWRSIMAEGWFAGRSPAGVWNYEDALRQEFGTMDAAIAELLQSSRRLCIGKVILEHHGEMIVISYLLSSE